VLTFWEQQSPLSWALLPLSWGFCGGVRLRQLAYRRGWLKSYRSSIPLIIIGNITVGGTGKTPFVIALAKYFINQGINPAIISRGYGGKAAYYPQVVEKNSDPQLVGDEPVVMAQHLTCPIVVSPIRKYAVEYIEKNYHCAIILSDDGLQHYALQRDMEIVLMGEQGLGNGFCLPAGALREPINRLKTVDFILHKNQDFLLKAQDLQHLTSSKKLPLNQWANQTVHAMAGIGNPDSFFKQLQAVGVKIIPHSFPDHHRFKPSDICFNDHLPVVMTEKDAVKCRAFATSQHWFLPVETEISEHFFISLREKLQCLNLFSIF
jgi:tetraacyldisaccharide 4'-kinase